MRISSKGISDGRDRKRLSLSLGKVGRHFRDGVSRERIRQVEAAEKLSPALRRDYMAALRLAIAERERMCAIISASAMTADRESKRAAGR